MSSALVELAFDLIGPQRGCGADQVTETQDRLAGLGGVVLAGEPARHAGQFEDLGDTGALRTTSTLQSKPFD